MKRQKDFIVSIFFILIATLTYADINFSAEFRKDTVHNIDCNSNSGIIDTLTWRTFYDDYPFGVYVLKEDFSQGDSVAIWFKPLAPCTLKTIRFCMGLTSSMDLYIDIFQSRYDGHITDKDSTNVNGWIGYNEDGQWVPGWVLGHSPLGEHIWGPFPYTMLDESRGWFEIPTKVIGEPYINANSFFVSFWIAETRKNNCFGMEDGGTIPYNFFRYYRTNADSPGNIHRGWFLMSPSLWIDAVVSYPANTPPVVSNMTVQNDTYGPGPFPIEAHIEDVDVEDPGRAGVASAHLVWEINGVTDSTAMYSFQEDNRYRGEIPIIASGDTVHYYISAVDLAGARTWVVPNSFARLIPQNPQADILLVRYSIGEGCYITHTRLLDSLGYAYECWNILEHRGIDESVYKYGWSTVIPIGISSEWWDRSSTFDLFPTREYAGNIWADYLDSGTPDNSANILYLSTGYFDHYEDLHAQPDLTRTFGEGDFVHDYFGIEWLDLEIDTSRYYWGFENDPITGDFFNDPLKVVFYPPGAFIETKTRKEANNLFITEGRVVGTRYDGGGFKTVFLPWNLRDFLSNDFSSYYTHEFKKLIRNTLDWFGASTGQTGIEYSVHYVPERYILDQNYPNPFNLETQISFGLPEGKHVELTVYNILGQVVETLVDSDMQAGQHTVKWSGQNFSSGIYFYTLTTEDFVKTRKMLVLK